MMCHVASRKSVSFRLIAGFVLASFVLSLVTPPRALAQVLSLPAPGSMVTVSPAYTPVIARGLKVHPENPLLFDFIIDAGDSKLAVEGAPFQAESEKLIKYFLASLTVKADDQWVNLSPYEKDRIIPDDLGKTELGRDMLAQDYILKQLTASLVYPEKGLGKEFWARIYAKARAQFGTIDIPVDTFNKVWITADKAKVLERHNTAYITDAHLKVMLESDYMAAQVTQTVTGDPVITPTPASAWGGNGRGAQELAKQVMREVIIPQIEQEVNEGQNFTQLRQIFYAMILSTWYKRALKDALLNQVYTNKSKINGVTSDDPAVKEKIYAQYLAAYRKGVFNYIKEEPQASGETIARKYFSGGLQIPPGIENAMTVDHAAETPVPSSGKQAVVAMVVHVTDAATQEIISPEAVEIQHKIERYANVPWQNWPADVLQWYSVRVAQMITQQKLADDPEALALLKRIGSLNNGTTQAGRSLFGVAMRIGLSSEQGELNPGMAMLVDHIIGYPSGEELKVQIKPEFQIKGTVVEVDLKDIYLNLQSSDQVLLRREKSSPNIDALIRAAFSKEEDSLKHLLGEIGDDFEISSYTDAGNAFRDLLNNDTFQKWLIHKISTGNGFQLPPGLSMEYKWTPEQIFRILEVNYPHEFGRNKQSRLARLSQVMRKKISFEKTILEVIKKNGKVTHQIRRAVSHYVDRIKLMDPQKIQFIVEYPLKIDGQEARVIFAPVDAAATTPGVVDDGQATPQVEALLARWQAAVAGGKELDKELLIVELQDVLGGPNQEAMVLGVVNAAATRWFAVKDKTTVEPYSQLLKRLYPELVVRANGDLLKSKQSDAPGSSIYVSANWVSQIFKQAKKDREDLVAFAKKLKGKIKENSDLLAKLREVSLEGTKSLSEVVMDSTITGFWNIGLTMGLFYKDEDAGSHFNQKINPVVAAELIYVTEKDPQDHTKIRMRSAFDNATVVDGGIDINSNNLSLDVAREGRGVEMALDPAMVAQFERGDFSGVVPVILNITPISSPLPLLGLGADSVAKPLAS